MLSGSPFDSGIGHNLSTITPNGSFLYSSGGTTTRAQSIDTGTGALTTVAGTPFGSSCVSSMVVDNSSNFLYLVEPLSGDLEHWTIDSAGAITQTSTINPGYPDPIGPMSTSSQASRIYGAANTSTFFEIVAFNLDAAGNPTVASTTPMNATADAVASLAINSTGTSLVAAETNRNTLQRFSVGASGAVTNDQEIADGTSLISSKMAYSPGNDFVWIANQTGDIITYQVNGDGSLSRMTTISAGAVISGMKVRAVTESTVQ